VSVIQGVYGHPLSQSVFILFTIISPIFAFGHGIGPHATFSWFSSLGNLGKITYRKQIFVSHPQTM